MIDAAAVPPGETEKVREEVIILGSDDSPDADLLRWLYATRYAAGEAEFVDLVPKEWEEKEWCDSTVQVCKIYHNKSGVASVLFDILTAKNSDVAALLDPDKWDDRDGVHFAKTYYTSAACGLYPTPLVTPPPVAPPSPWPIGTPVVFLEDVRIGEYRSCFINLLSVTRLDSQAILYNFCDSIDSSVDGDNRGEPIKALSEDCGELGVKVLEDQREQLCGTKLVKFKARRDQNGDVYTPGLLAPSLAVMVDFIAAKSVCPPDKRKFKPNLIDCTVKRLDDTASLNCPKKDSEVCWKAR
jgi:hypothetical protein